MINFIFESKQVADIAAARAERFDEVGEKLSVIEPLFENFENKVQYAVRIKLELTCKNI